MYLAGGEVGDDDGAFGEPDRLFGLDPSFGSQVDDAILVALRRKGRQRGEVRLGKNHLQYSAGLR